jgi:hypothetical protein
MTTKSLEERIAAIEQKCVHPTIPGTQITRVLDKNGARWSIAIGPMSMPKAFFDGKTIEECLKKAEKAFKTSVKSEWGAKVSK